MERAPATQGRIEDHIAEPRTIEETGLTPSYLADLALKTLYYRNGLTGAEISDLMALPFWGVVDQVLAFLKREDLIATLGSKGYGEASYRWGITNKGSERAAQVLERDMYIGPAPVPLERYNDMVHRQAFGQVTVRPQDVEQALSHLVLGEDLLGRLGPAINSGRSLFLYGPPGNGKSSIARSIIRMIKGAVYYPYAVLVDGQLIRVFDEVNHVRANGASPGEPQPEKLDRRWIRIRRPEIVVGGELMMQSLDLIYDPISKTYDAPFQMKANTGLFVVDDFGRQMIRPQDLLNRWILPLETRVDFLTLRTGKKIEVPFDELIVFATNLDPRDLVDDAFLRRIRHKLRIGDPDLDTFYKIMRRECAARGLEPSAKVFDYLVQKNYVAANRNMRSCHPRDILDNLQDIAAYLGMPAVLSTDLIDAACEIYFADI